jgi:hypothetical protein
MSMDVMDVMDGSEAEFSADTIRDSNYANNLKSVWNTETVTDCSLKSIVVGI